MGQEGGRRILVVDDEPDAVEFVKAVLAEAGYEIISASNGVEGLQKARDGEPDLVILDVQMPEKDGFATFDDMRKDPALKAIPVVMLTGVGERTGLKFSAADMGDYFGEQPDAYIEKPIDPQLLVEAVQKALGD